LSTLKNYTRKRPGRVLLRFINAALIVITLGGMTSCLGLNADIELNSDNSGTLSLEYRFSRMLDSLGRLEGNEGRQPVPVGRVDFERTVDRLPGMKLLSYASKEDPRDRIITARLQFSNIEALLGFLDAAGEKAVYSREESQKLTFVLNRGGGSRNPELDALIGQITEGYQVNISMSFPSTSASAGTRKVMLMDREGGPLNVANITFQGNKAACSLPLGAVLSAEKGLILEFLW
jgi:hypothetical protein